jgi:tetratricopeptide (TPR) repeat protein
VNFPDQRTDEVRLAWGNTMKHLRSVLRLQQLQLCVLVLLPAVVFAQQGPGGVGGFVGIESINTTSITVQVRAPDGSKFKSMAIVNLTNMVGQMLKSQTTFGSQTVFQVGAGAYTVDVEAFGFEKARLKTEVSSAAPNRVVVVTLKPDAASGLNYVSGSNVTLSPKAQREVVKGTDAFQVDKLDEAIRHLESAHQLVPTHPDIPYFLGIVYEKKNDSASARKYWDEAVQADPKHVISMLACGEMLLRQNDIEGSRKYLDKAVEVAPNSWRAHNLLATALLRQNSYADAVTHAGRAVDLGREQASSALLILGQALAAQGQNEQAIAALKDYLASKPSDQQTLAVQKLIMRLDTAATAPAASSVGGITTPVVDATLASDVPDPPLTPALLRWLPPNVDDAVPPVEAGVSCSLDDVLKNVSTRVQELPAVVDRYTATEVLHQEDVNNAGVADKVSDLSFNYLASVREIKNKYGSSLDVQEYRNGSTGTEMFPNQMASVGLPSIVLIFHPMLVKDFEMKCEGLSRATGDFAWQVYFRQSADRESRIRRYRMGGHVFPIALKGRAWIDANTFQVVRLETDLRELHPELRLNSEHLVMQYGPIKFKSREEELWLPSSADYYAVLRGQRFHRRHSFTNYILFSIEDKQQIGAPPKDKTTSGSRQE